MNDFLVYRYVDVEQQSVLYVGMGRGDRPSAHWKKRASNPLFGNVLARMRAEGRVPLIEIVQDGLTAEQAAFREQALIAFYGRRCDSSGPLCNISLGGLSPIYGVVPTEAQKAARNANFEVARTNPEVQAKRIAAVRAGKRTAEARRKTSFSVKAAQTEEVLLKIGAGTKARMADPVFRAKVLASAHTPAASAKRQKSLAAFANSDHGRQLRREAALARWNKVKAANDEQTFQGAAHASVR